MSEIGDIGVPTSVPSSSTPSVPTPVVAVSTAPLGSTKAVPKTISENIKTQLPTIIVGALTVTAGLAWNTAITALINYYVPPEYRTSNNAWFQVLYAFVLTIILVIIMALILKYTS